MQTDDEKDICSEYSGELSQDFSAKKLIAPLYTGNFVIFTLALIPQFRIAERLAENERTEIGRHPGDDAGQQCNTRVVILCRYLFHCVSQAQVEQDKQTQARVQDIGRRLEKLESVRLRARA